MIDQLPKLEFKALYTAEEIQKLPFGKVYSVPVIEDKNHFHGILKKVQFDSEQVDRSTQTEPEDDQVGHLDQNTFNNYTIPLTSAGFSTYRNQEIFRNSYQYPYNQESNYISHPCPYYSSVPPPARPPSPPPGFHLYPQTFPLVTDVCPVVTNIPVYKPQPGPVYPTHQFTEPLQFHTASTGLRQDYIYPSIGVLPNIQQQSYSSTTLVNKPVKLTDITRPLSKNQSDIGSAKPSGTAARPIERSHKDTPMRDNRKEEENDSAELDISTIPLPIGPAPVRSFRNKHKSTLEKIQESPEHYSEVSDIDNEMPHLEKAKNFNKISIKFEETNLQAKTEKAEPGEPLEKDEVFSSGKQKIHDNGAHPFQNLTQSGCDECTGYLLDKDSKANSILKQSSEKEILEDLSERPLEVYDVAAQKDEPQASLCPKKSDEGVVTVSQKGGDWPERKDGTLKALLCVKSNAGKLEMNKILKSPEPLRRPKYGTTLGNLIQVKTEGEKHGENHGSKELSQKPSEALSELHRKSLPDSIVKLEPITPEEKRPEDIQISENVAEGPRSTKLFGGMHLKTSTSLSKVENKNVPTLRDAVRKNNPTERNKDVLKSQVNWCKGYLEKALKEDKYGEDWDKEIAGHNAAKPKTEDSVASASNGGFNDTNTIPKTKGFEKLASTEMHDRTLDKEIAEPEANVESKGFKKLTSSYYQTSFSNDYSSKSLVNPAKLQQEECWDNEVGEVTKTGDSKIVKDAVTASGDATVLQNKQNVNEESHTKCIDATKDANNNIEGLDKNLEMDLKPAAGKSSDNGIQAAASNEKKSSTRKVLSEKAIPIIKDYLGMSLNEMFFFNKYI